LKIPYKWSVFSGNSSINRGFSIAMFDSDSDSDSVQPFSHGGQSPKDAQRPGAKIGFV
jgi:hypothetical protein